MRHARRSIAVVLAALGLTTGVVPARADVKLPPVLSSHMVLQRDMPVPIWGTAANGEKVTVKFREQVKSTAADSSGKWLVKLDPLKAGGPNPLTVSGKNCLTLDDVLVGEVWVGSGQSNMQMAVASYTQGDAVLEKNALAAPYPRLRLLSPGGQGWKEATPENVQKFSALAFSFGLPLQKALNVPVGLLQGAVGGTPSGYWLSAEAYRADGACKAVAQKFAVTYSLEKEQAKYALELAKWEQDFAAAKAKQAAAKNQNSVRLPRKPVAPVNPGECTGKLGFLYESYIRPYQPYAIRGVLWDQGESGTAICGVDQYTLMGALIRGWRKEWGQGDFPFLYVQKPSGSGCAWDFADPVTIRAQKFSPLPKTVPGTGEGLYTNTHLRIMQYPHTAMVTSSDLGPGVHPVNKSGYGLRACRVALGMVYGNGVEIYGPVFQSQQCEGRKIRLRFTHVGQGLAVPQGQKLQGFAVAGADQKFAWAEAVIDGNSVVLSSKEVAQPQAVRYAWGNTYPWANLFNKDGLPALPFRSDAW